jgi:hypothetical protein
MEASQMEEELDKTLKELATGLSFATLIFTLIALIMIRFGYTRPDNDIWKCLLFLLKGCICGWFYLWGRYSAKELLRARAANSELIQKHSDERLHEQKLRLGEQISTIELKFKNLKRELESSKLREEALAQKLKAFTRTPADANKNALKSFL